MSVYEKLLSVLLELAATASQTAAYVNWSDGFSRKEVKDVWQNAENGLRRPREFSVTRSDILGLTKEQCWSLGFRMWDDSGLILIPLWIWNYIADGEQLRSISGADISKHSGLDLDTRIGVTPYGVI